MCVRSPQNFHQISSFHIFLLAETGKEITHVQKKLRMHYSLKHTVLYCYVVVIVVAPDVLAAKDLRGLVSLSFHILISNVGMFYFFTQIVQYHGTFMGGHAIHFLHQLRLGTTRSRPARVTVAFW